MCETCKTARRVLELLAQEAARQGLDVETVKRYDNEKEYRQAIDNAARQFWKDGSRGGFITRMKEITKFGLRTAFATGAKQVGVSEADFTERDIKERDAIITQEQTHIQTLLDFIDDKANTPETSVTSLQPRLDLWIQRYNDVINRARVIVGMDVNLEWVYGDTKHCPSCFSLNGIVKRASFWKAANVYPKRPPNKKLKCGGWKCQCELKPTAKPVTRNPLPSLP